MDYNNWMDLATYKRNMEKELQLFNLLGLEENEKYNLTFIQNNGISRKTN